MAGQTINDRLLAARHSLAGQGLAKSVCKATTEEMIGPKKKHLDYLVHCTNEPNVSIPHLANLLVERTQNANWVVVYKSLLTVHHLLAYGNERFMQYLASSNSTFNLNNFLDKGGVQGAVGVRIGYDMSPFIRRYAKYLNDKALSYRTVAFDFCKVKRGKEEGSLRTMNADKLLKTLPVLQAQLDSLLEFDCQANDLANGVINMCFMLLFRDLIRLFACYNDGIINLLEKYFDMNKKQCRDALDLYKKFLVRMDRVGEFLKVAENVGIDKGDIPDLTKAPSSLLEALEGHLASVEGKKGSAANTPTQSTSNQKNVKSGVSALSSTSSSFGTAAASTRFDTHNTNGGGSGSIDESIKAQALADEEAAMNQYRSKIASPTNAAAATNPFLSTPPASNQQTNIVDLFSGGGASGSSNLSQTTTDSAQINNQFTKASDDLLQLGNPFADMFSGAPALPAIGNVPGAADNNMWLSNGFNGTGTTGTIQQQPTPPNSHNTFVTESNFSSVFGATEPVGFDALGDVLKPGLAATNVQSSDNNILTAGILTTSQQQYHQQQQQLLLLQQQQHQQQQQQQQLSLSNNPNAGGKVLTGDLDSSLASLAENLTINKSASAQVKGVQWNSPKNTAKPASWQPQPMAATTGVGYRPMQGMPMRPQQMSGQSATGTSIMQPNIIPTMNNSMSTGSGQSAATAIMPGLMQQQQSTLLSQQSHAIVTSTVVATDQNNKNNIQLDPFGAF